MRKIGDVIKSLREEKLLSQTDLANKLNVGRSTVAMWEKNERVPNEETKEAICDFFNVDMNYLYGKTPIRNSYRDGEMTDYVAGISDLGNHEANLEYLKNNPELLETYLGVVKNDNMRILFDKAKKLSPEEVEAILNIVNQFVKEVDNE